MDGDLTTPVPTHETSAAQARRGLRLTGSALADLAIWMVGLGLLTGLVFPFFVLALGVSPRQALSPTFFAATLGAGLLVGGFNFVLARAVVGRRLKLLSTRTRLVADTIHAAAATGDWSRCDMERSRIPVDSEDELGDSARAFNQLVEAIDYLRSVEAELEVSRNQARTDELTGLSNRRHFYLACDLHLQAARERGHSIALLLIDLDRFKELNDSFGHHVGDHLLREVAGRLRAALPNAEVLARLGGDEFVVLLPAGDHPGDAVQAANAFLAALEAPFMLDGLQVYLGASVGIAVGSDRFETRATLLRQADVAMYRAKASGGGTALYSPDDDEHTRERIVLAGELRAALDRDELVVHYQPKADIATGTVSSVEALVRWQHPTRGLLAPAAFLGLAEHYGLMRRITLRVLRLCLLQAHHWRDARRPLRIAVNLAAANLLDAGFPEEVAALLDETGVPPELLQLEITENMIMADPVRVSDVVARLSELGFTFALDDFGTGSSSLANLKRLPIEELKIDRSFVTNMEHSSDDAVIVRSTIDLARNLGLQVVAEGVESSYIWDRLADFGCHGAQGYLLTPPLAPEQFDSWLAAYHAATNVEDAAA
jgi:diguanylate cyclase (GGDEF)-like protein